jgi:hypothetical protein
MGCGMRKLAVSIDSSSKRLFTAPKELAVTWLPLGTALRATGSTGRALGRLEHVSSALPQARVSVLRRAAALGTAKLFGGNAQAPCSRA